MSEAGLIITNAHVVSRSNAASGRQQLKVQLQSGDAYEATIQDIDKKSDIATIIIHPKVCGLTSGVPCPGGLTDQGSQSIPSTPVPTLTVATKADLCQGHRALYSPQQLVES